MIAQISNNLSRNLGLQIHLTKRRKKVNRKTIKSPLKQNLNIRDQNQRIQPFHHQMVDLIEMVLRIISLKTIQSCHLRISQYRNRRHLQKRKGKVLISRARILQAQNRLKRDNHLIQQMFHPLQIINGNNLNQTMKQREKKVKKTQARNTQFCSLMSI